MGHETPGSTERPTDADLAAALARFRLRFGDDEDCLAHAERARWPKGFTCPACGWQGEPCRFQTRPRVLGCRGCQKHVSITAGTAMERAHLPLPTWYAAAALLWLDPALSTRRLMRLLGLASYGTTFALRATVRRDQAAGRFPWPSVDVGKTPAFRERAVPAETPDQFERACDAMGREPREPAVGCEPPARTERAHPHEPPVNDERAEVPDAD